MRNAALALRSFKKCAVLPEAVALSWDMFVQRKVKMFPLLEEELGFMRLIPRLSPHKKAH